MGVAVGVAVARAVEVSVAVVVVVEVAVPIGVAVTEGVAVVAGVGVIGVFRMRLGVIVGGAGCPRVDVDVITGVSVWVISGKTVSVLDS
jgi:hypothetical protein